MQPDLPDRLRALRDLLSRVAAADWPGPEVHERAGLAAERLDRDLLPRTAGAHAHLVVGIVGPNNAGKSALFNALAGRTLSPSLATGGATRRLVGAAHPALRERLAAEPTLAQFAIAVVEPGENGVREALDTAGDPSTLLLVEDEGLPRELLIVDTPDFDSVTVANRAASAALLRVCDLAVVVVTRHTYQNQEVVRFLESWLAHGRPWLLVYNESLGAAVTREHAAKLAGDLASDPVALFHAPFDMGVAEGAKPLVPTGLTGDSRGTTLGEWLFERARAEELKESALAASLFQLEDEVRGLGAALAVEGEASAAVLTSARARAAQLGREVAARAMPMTPFLDAFRSVLDKRPNLLQRGYRGALKRGRLLLEKAAARVPFLKERVPKSEGRIAPRLVEAERLALGALWPAYFEDLSRALDPRRHGADAAGLDAVLAERVATDLAPGAAAPALARARESLSADPEVLRAFQEACEELIEAELDASGTEWFFQIAVDLVHVLPAVAAGVVIVKTGGLGTDVAVGGAGAVSSMLAERVSRLLGTGLARQARERWTAMRGTKVAYAALAATLEESQAALERRVSEQGAASAELDEQRKEIAWRMERT